MSDLVKFEPDPLINPAYSTQCGFYFLKLELTLNNVCINSYPVPLRIGPPRPMIIILDYKSINEENIILEAGQTG